MKVTSSFVCQECGYESAQWLGKCPECGEWNSLREIKNEKFKIQNSKESRDGDIKPKTLSEIKYDEKTRITTGFSEVDRVLGGGVVLGSVTLLAGDPGIGKSTLLLQLGLHIANKKFEVLYISGEESEEQIKQRAMRLFDKINPSFFVVSITNTDAAISIIEEKKPAFVIVDSVQTMESENLSGLAGSVGQVRYAAFSFIKLAKLLAIPIILIGHVTKEGMVAGPMILSHMVDTMLFLEGEKTTGTRILRGLKNRFGPIDEVGIFAMEGQGLRELKNPESLFINKNNKKIPGSVLTAPLEGTRAFLVEVQSLVLFSKSLVLKRIVSGLDRSRVELLLAVLQKHARLPLDTTDVFVNVAGGFKISDRASDLGICLSILSSLKNIPLSNTVCIAEVGLLGELRSVPFLDKRIKQAKRLGFRNIITAETHRYIGEVVQQL